MRAIVYTHYGPADVLQFIEVPTPSPKDDEVLIGIHAASVNPVDWHYMRGTPYLVRMVAGWRRPKVTRLGIDVAGTVRAVGRNVTRLQPGDEVFGACRGSFAEHVCAPEGALALRPANITAEQAAAVPVAALSALQGLRDRGQVQRGQKVLINGASGGVGTFAVQIANALGAEVTGVCSTRNMGTALSIGAHHVIDYTQEDFTESGVRYDLILDAVGNRSLADCRRALATRGALVIVGGSDKGRWLGPLSRSLKAAAWSPFVSQRLLPFLARLGGGGLEAVRELLEAGKVTPVIDRSYALSEVPEAIRYLEEGHARGKIVIRVERRGET